MLRKADGLYDTFFNRTVFRACDDSGNKINLDKIFSKTKIGIMFSIAMIFVFTFASFHYSAAIMTVSGILVMGLTYALYSSDNKYNEAEKRFEALTLCCGFFYASLVQTFDNLFVTIYVVSCLLYTYSAIVTVREKNNIRRIMLKCAPCILIICLFSLMDSYSLLYGNMITNVIGLTVIYTISGVAGFNAMHIINNYLPELETANAREEYSYTLASIFITIPITWIIDAYETTRT